MVCCVKALHSGEPRVDETVVAVAPSLCRQASSPGPEKLVKVGDSPGWRLRAQWCLRVKRTVLGVATSLEVEYNLWY